MEALLQPRPSLYRAHFHHSDIAGWAFVVRDSRELSEDAVGDRSQHRDRTDSFSFIFREVAEYRQRVYHRYQRGHFAAFAGLLALRGVQHRFDCLEVCVAGEGAAHLESIEFRHFGDVVPGARDGG